MDNSLRSRFIEKLFFPTGFEYIIVPFDRRNSSSENIVTFVKIVEIRLCILSKMKYDSRCIISISYRVIKLDNNIKNIEIDDP